MGDLVGSLVMSVWAAWISGTVLVWPFWYFGRGVNKAKRSYGIDWREFRWSYFGCAVAWPYFLLRWFQGNGTGEKIRAVVYLEGEEVRKMLSTADYEVNDRCEATVRTQPLPDQSALTTLCIICGEDLAELNPQDKLSHFIYSHIDDVPGTLGDVIELRCGCPQMRWPAIDLRTEDVLPHLRSSHGLKA